MKLDNKEINGHYVESLVLIASVPSPFSLPPFLIYACNLGCHQVQVYTVVMTIWNVKTC